jgi:hypothetical protein
MQGDDNPFKFHTAVAIVRSRWWMSHNTTEVIIVESLAQHKIRVIMGSDTM